MDFEIVGEITAVEVIAAGKGIRRLEALLKKYGKGRWRKIKGIAVVRLTSGDTVKAEVHWYETHGIGRRGFKIKRILG